MWFPFLTSRRRSTVARTRRTPELTRLTLETLEERVVPSVTPNDPRFHQQWGLEVTEAPPAWEITTGSTRVTVAVTDAGIDYTHPDLYKNIWLNQEEISTAIRSQLQDVDGDGLITFWDLNEPVNQGPGRITDLNGTGFIDGGDLLRPVAQGGWADGIDNGGNGYVDDLIGWDSFDNDNDPMDTDPHGHGTAVAGILGAIGNNGVEVAGVNWQVQMMPLRYQTGDERIDFSPSGFERVLDAGLVAGQYALDNGARVISNSTGAHASLLPPEFVAAESALLDEAAARDVLFVTSAGNDREDLDVVPRLPGSFPHDNIITVAATDKNDNLASFSSFGLVAVDLGAPGNDIRTTGNGSFAGCSAATPFVAGTAALILSVNPTLSFAEVKALILDNVDPAADLAGKTVTGGRLNVFKAVSATPLPLSVSSVGSPGTALPITEQATPQRAEALRPSGNANVDTSLLHGIDLRALAGQNPFAGRYTYNGEIQISISGSGRIKSTLFTGNVSDDGSIALTFGVPSGGDGLGGHRGSSGGSGNTITLYGIATLDQDGNLHIVVEWPNGSLEEFDWLRRG